MSIIAKARKLLPLLRRNAFRSALFHMRVAAGVEHLEVITFCAPAALLDVGANKGQFSLAVIALFPDIVIHAFEPLPAAGDRFAKVFARNGSVELHRVAIGAKETTSRFHVTDRQDSSSLLEPGPGQASAFGVQKAQEIQVHVLPLERVVDLKSLPCPVMLKIDVQGAELEVLHGISCYSLIDYVYVELSFVELYKNQPLFQDVAQFLAIQGFVLRGVFNQSVTTQFGPTQADFLFVRSPAVEHGALS